MSYEFDPNASQPEAPGDPSPTPEEKESRGWGAWIVALILVALVGAGAWWYLHRATSTPAPAETAATAPAPAPVAEAPASPDVPPAQAQRTLREWLGRLLDSPDARWFAGGDLARRVAGVISAVANGEDPRGFLRPLAPRAPFKVEEKDGKVFMSEKGFARFDWAARQLRGLHADRAPEIWQAIRPSVASAWREIAPRGSSLDDALNRAVGNVLSVQVPDGPVELVPEGAVYRYADSALEALSPAQKILIRMGPANAKVLQDQVRALGQALGLASAK